VARYVEKLVLTALEVAIEARHGSSLSKLGSPSRRHVPHLAWPSGRTIESAFETT